MFVRKERGRNARKSRRLRVSFQTREAIPFPEITLIATVTWYSVTVRTELMRPVPHSGRNLAFIIGAE